MNDDFSINSITVVGLGYVGLPTSAILANAGFSVYGVDINKNLIDSLNNGFFKFDEPHLESLFTKSFKLKKLKISKNIFSTDAYIICVPTPCTKNKKADLSYLFSAIETISSKIQNNSLIIIESTIPIGTTESCKEKLLNLRKDLDKEKLYFSHCPERVLPGNAVFEIVNNDRVIGGLDQDSINKADFIYSKFSKGNIFHTSSKVAEMVKLSENTFRDVNIALANQLALIAEKSEININEVINLANRHPRVNIHKSGIGVGGHCIPIDPYFLIDDYNFECNLISKARELNEFIESITLNKIISFFEINNDVDIKNIYLYGLSYKANINDFRESPSLRIVENLANKIKNKKLYAVDPYLKEEYDKTNIRYRKSIKDLNNSMLVILVKHELITHIINKVDNYNNLKILDLT